LTTLRLCRCAAAAAGRCVDDASQGTQASD
jgi:hypothetical protein